MKLLQLSYGWQRGFMKCGIYVLGCFLCQWSLILWVFFFHRPKKVPCMQLYSEGFYGVLVKAGICVILGAVLCFDSVLLPCLTDISPISGLPPEPGQCGRVSRVRGQPSWSTTKKEKQKELWSNCCWQILAKTQRKVNIHCWYKTHVSKWRSLLCINKYF